MSDISIKAAAEWVNSPPADLPGLLLLLTDTNRQIETSKQPQRDLQGSRTAIIAFAATVVERKPAAASLPLRHVTQPGEYICVLFVLLEKRILGQSRLSGGVALLPSLSLSPT